VVVEPRHQLLAECEQLATRASHDSDYGRRLCKLLWHFSFIGFPPKRLQSPRGLICFLNKFILFLALAVYSMVRRIGLL
jgi:hypothetical protein